MKKLTAALLLTVAGIMTILPVQADGIRDRIEHQRDAIERGLETGELTRREAMKLHREQRELRALAEDMRDAGTSRLEQRRILDAQLDRIDRHIEKSLRRNRDDDRSRPDDRYRPAPNERAERFNNRPENFNDNNGAIRQPWER